MGDKGNLKARLDDLTSEPIKATLAPIHGLENVPLVGLVEAMQPLLEEIPDAAGFAEQSIEKAKTRELIHDGLSLDEAASIFLYTANGCQVFRRLNGALRKENRDALVPFFPYLRLLLEALSKMPRYEGTLNRGLNFGNDSELMEVVRAEYAGLKDSGSSSMWWGFSSTTTNMGMLEGPDYLGPTGNRILCTLTNVTCAFNITKYSFFPSEEEVVLPPGWKFNVVGVLKPDPTGGLVLVNLQETSDYVSIVPALPPLRFATKEWPHCFAYMKSDEIGNVQGFSGETGISGHFNLVKRKHGNSYLIQSCNWTDWYLYMSGGEEGNVRGWKGDPGPQGYWRIKYQDDGTALLSTDCWPECFMYMQNNAEGNVRGWTGDPGPQGHWIISRLPATFKSAHFSNIQVDEKPVFLVNKLYPNLRLFMNSDKEGTISCNEQSDTLQHQWVFTPSEESKGAYQLTCARYPAWFTIVNNDKTGTLRGWNDKPGQYGQWLVTDGGDGYVHLASEKYPTWRVCVEEDGSVHSLNGAANDSCCWKLQAAEN